MSMMMSMMQQQSIQNACFLGLPMALPPMMHANAEPMRVQMGYEGKGTTDLLRHRAKAPLPSVVEEDEAELENRNSFIASEDQALRCSSRL